MQEATVTRLCKMEIARVEREVWAWIKDHAAEVLQHQGKFLAIHPDRGILRVASSKQELEAQMQQESLYGLITVPAVGEN